MQHKVITFFNVPGTGIFFQRENPASEHSQNERKSSENHFSSYKLINLVIYSEENKM